MAMGSSKVQEKSAPDKCKREGLESKEIPRHELGCKNETIGTVSHILLKRIITLEDARVGRYVENSM